MEGLTFDLGLQADLKMLNLIEGIASAKTTCFCLFCFAEHHQGDKSKVAGKAEMRPDNPKVINANNLKKAKGQVTISFGVYLENFCYTLPRLSE